MLDTIRSTLFYPQQPSEVGTIIVLMLKVEERRKKS